ncbi:UTP--glucose-1-phosphate uridylyltransferase [Candidatus Saccharibacteria bacterium]|nr:UTP--glucose-1-phosphate uridylyltransferase [Candidatus Saccharibacteria bacterium]
MSRENSMTMRPIKKAIILTAGYGTRMLPATKSSPKEMLHVVDKPIIHYIVDEAVASGIEEIIFVTSSNKRPLEDYFDRNRDLEAQLRQSGKLELLEEIRGISEMATFAYLRQGEQRGPGDALKVALPFVGEDESVAVLFGDDIVDSEVPALQQLIEVYQEYGDPVIAAKRVDHSVMPSKGMIVGSEIDNRVIQVKSIVEKPDIRDIVSDIAAQSRMILTPDVLRIVAGMESVDNRELYHTDALARYLEEGGILYALDFEGDWYDCGNKLGLIQAQIGLGLKDPTIANALREYLGRI